MWRLTGMSAAALTLIAVLFFHDNQPQPASTAAINHATYAPKPANPVKNLDANRITSALNRQSAADASVPAASASSANSQDHIDLPKQPKQASSLSLATPGDVQDKASSLNSALGGRTYADSASVDGYKIPLPAGDWVVLSNAHFKSPQATGELVFLGQVSNRHLIGGVRISAVRSTGQDGEQFPPKLKGCVENQGNALYVAPEAMDSNGHQSCWLIDSYFTPPLQQWADRAIKLPALDRAAAGDMAAKGVSYPQDFIRIRMTRTEKWGLLEVSYLFSPTAAGIKSNEVISMTDSDWTRENISRFPEKVAYVDKLKQWGIKFWPRFKSMFDDSAQK